MKRITNFSIAALVVLLPSALNAQELPVPTPAATMAGPPAPESIGGPVVESAPYSVGGESLAPIPEDQTLWECGPAVTESTGTWLRRGFWYTELEAVVLTRYWDRNAPVLAQDVNFLGVNGGFDINVERDALEVNRSKPGAEGHVRFTLGRFLFRDVENRDHTSEFTGFGGGEWSQRDAITSDPAAPNQLVVPSTFDLNNLSFDNSNRMTTKYDSRLTSFECNYRVHTRLGRDQMVMQPNGEWVRRQSSNLTHSFLAGMRYIDLTENFEWNAFDIRRARNVTTAGPNGSYFARTSNDLFGGQVGGSTTYEGDRFSLEGFAKTGIFFSDAKAKTHLNYVNATTGNPQGGTFVDFNTDNREGPLSYMLQAGVVGRWHIRPNLSVRAGYEMLYLTNMAMAPDQLKFDPDYSTVSTSGDPFYHGVTAGSEFFW